MIEIRIKKKIEPMKRTLPTKKSKGETIESNNTLISTNEVLDEKKRQAAEPLYLKRYE